MRPRVLLRWAGRVAAAALGVLVLAAAGTYGASEYKLTRRHEVPAHPFAVAPLGAAAAAARVARGEHLATVRGCRDCHGENLAGHLVVDDPAVGRIAGANLTRGGRGALLTDRDWERAVRHGVRRDGSPLLVMPSAEFTGISDEDLAAIVAYVRSLPAVAAAPPRVTLGPVLRGLAAAGVVRPAADEIDHARAHPARVAAEPTARYGAYLAAGCTGCHGPGLSGGKIPGAPPDWKPSANITPAGIGHYTEADFVRALRTGVRPGGAPIDTAMPWPRLTSKMTDVELRALYAYLRTVPPRPYGHR